MCVCVCACACQHLLRPSQLIGSPDNGSPVCPWLFTLCVCVCVCVFVYVCVFVFGLECVCVGVSCIGVRMCKYHQIVVCVL